MLNAVNHVCLSSLMDPHVMLVEYEMYSRLFIFLFLDKNPGWVPDCQRLEQIGLWSTSQLSLWSGVFTWRPELFLRCLLYKVISFIISTLYIEHCHLILPLFVATCEIWLPGLTYGVYLVLFLKPGATACVQTYDVTRTKLYGANLNNTVIGGRTKLQSSWQGWGYYSLVQGPVTSVHRSPEARAHGAERKTEEDKIELQASATRQSAQRSHSHTAHSQWPLFVTLFFFVARSLSLGRGSKATRAHGGGRLEDGRPAALAMPYDGLACLCPWSRRPCLDRRIGDRFTVPNYCSFFIW
jgi:hypothetical protein